MSKTSVYAVFLREDPEAGLIENVSGIWGERGGERANVDIQLTSRKFPKHGRGARFLLLGRSASPGQEPVLFFSAFRDLPDQIPFQTLDGIISELEELEQRYRGRSDHDGFER